MFKNNSSKNDLIKQILEHCDFESLSSYLEFNKINHLELSTNSKNGQYFRHLINKYNINQYELAKEISVSKGTDFQDTYHRIRNIGSEQPKTLKNNKEVIYVKNATKEDFLQLKKKLKEIGKLKSYSTLSDHLFLYKIEFVVKYLQIYMNNDNYKTLLNDLIDCTPFSIKKTDIENLLKNCDITLLNQLLSSLNNKSYINYFDEPEPLDPFDEFLDQTNIAILFFIYTNFDTIIEKLDEITYIFDIIRWHDDSRLYSVLLHLKQKRNISNPYFLANISYKNEFPIENEYSFRYKDMHSKLCSIDDNICDTIIWIFSQMTETKWNIICHIFRTYSCPNTKPVENFINKYLEPINLEYLY